MAISIAWLKPIWETVKYANVHCTYFCFPGSDFCQRWHVFRVKMESTIIPDNDQNYCCCLVSGKFISLSTARVTLRKHKWSHHSNILSCWQVSNFSRYKNLGIHHDRQDLRCNQFREIYTECTLSKSHKDENYALIWCHGALCVWFDVINLRSHWKRCFFEEVL